MLAKVAQAFLPVATLSQTGMSVLPYLWSSRKSVFLGKNY